MRCLPCSAATVRVKASRRIDRSVNTAVLQLESMSRRVTHFEDDEKVLLKLVVGSFDNNSYLLACRQTGAAVLIDAADEADLLVESASEFDLRMVLTTHGHHDHVQAVPEVRRLAGVPVGIHRGDAASLPGGADFFIEDGQVFEVGKLEVEARHTPGHTQGSSCFVVGELLFSGDTLFPGGPGNTWGSSRAFEQIIASIERALFVLPDETIVLPGHGLDTTIGEERPHLSEWMERGW